MRKIHPLIGHLTSHTLGGKMWQKHMACWDICQRPKGSPSWEQLHKFYCELTPCSNSRLVLKSLWQHLFSSTCHLRCIINPDWRGIELAECTSSATSLWETTLLPWASLSYLGQKYWELWLDQHKLHVGELVARVTNQRRYIPNHPESILSLCNCLSLCLTVQKRLVERFVKP